MKKKSNLVKLNPKAFGLAWGILCAVAMLVLSLCAMLCGKGNDWINLTAAFYVGYSKTISGMFIGMLYGFIDGFVGGFLLAWLYNKFR